MDHETKKEELIREAAIRLFSRNGFYNTRTEDIAHEAGVAVGTIYNYFANKEEILLAIFKTDFEERMQLFRKLLESDLSVPEKIRRILEEHFHRLQERGDLAQLLLQERFNPGPGFRTKLRELYREMLARVEKLIQEGMEHNWVRTCHPKIIAYALFGVVESISVYALTYPEEAAQGILSDAPAELADFIWNGLKKGGDNDD